VTRTSTRYSAAPADRIAAAFVSHGKRAALMPYLMGGFPDLAGSRRLGEALVDAGADLLEIGVPFSDPLADGPVIQLAGQRALEAGATLESVVEQVAAPLAERVPVALMCYSNPIHARGFEAFAAMVTEHGVAGLIVPDMPAEEADELRGVCDDAGLALIPLVAPTTPPAAVDEIGTKARGFVYVVSVTGVTGERAELPPALATVVERARKASRVPVAVGFDIGTPGMASKVADIADGVIIGSRLVRAVADEDSLDEGIAAAADFLGRTATALC
jgi:tryptophan synthase alpha chain